MISWQSTRAVNLYHCRLGYGEYLPCIIFAGYPRRLQQLGLAKEGPILGGEHTTGLEELGEVFYRVAEMTLINGEEDLSGRLERGRTLNALVWVLIKVLLLHALIIVVIVSLLNCSVDECKSGLCHWVTRSMGMFVRVHCEIVFLRSP